FLNNLPLFHETPDIIFVHAGIRPGLELYEQIEDDLLWIRRPFLDPAEDPGHPWPFGRTVVHGHTPDAFGVHPHRIGVDSGGYATGVFTAVEINSVGLRYHQLIRDDP
ncbi:MAG: serine/threonine protein phosphatase, partial [Pseudomonadota bacterium]